MCIVSRVIGKTHKVIDSCFPYKSPKAFVIVKVCGHLSHGENVPTFFCNMIQLFEDQVMFLPWRIFIRLSEIILIYRRTVIVFTLGLYEFLVIIQAWISEFVVSASRDDRTINVIADLKLPVFPEHELAPTVASTGQHVIEALVILHQIRENMFFNFVRLLNTLILQYSHVIGVVAKLFVTSSVIIGICFCLLLILGNKRVVRLHISLHFFRQNVLAKSFPYERATGFPQCHQLVGTIYFELHLHTTMHIHRNDLMHIVVFANHIDTVLIILLFC